MDIRELIQKREKTHGKAWAQTGQLLAPLGTELAFLLTKAPELFFPWIMITNKLLRILRNPAVVDHWQDIQGYAMLATGHLEQKGLEGDSNEVSSK